MKVIGSAVLNAPRDRVWTALNDPEVLVRTIPGCQQLEQVEADFYRATVNAGVASIKGVYSGEVKLTDQVEPESFILHAAGAGAPGTVSADVHVRLTDVDGGSTRLDYDADAVVGGMIAGVGQRMLASVAKRTAGDFFAAVDDVLLGRAELAAPAVGVPGVTGAPIEVAGIPEGQGPVYTAPPRARPGVPIGTVLGAAVLGALIALAGVLVGALIAR
ncbi:MAG TPA: carbon monoxide dehydrogenase subunit G [Jiangellaceae bacterium]|nr:carbon monoxide dehydrogenase subunit G [Jiangellaceae bacterium]